MKIYNFVKNLESNISFSKEKRNSVKIVLCYFGSQINTLSIHCYSDIEWFDNDILRFLEYEIFNI